MTIKLWLWLMCEGGHLILVNGRHPAAYKGLGAVIYLPNDDRRRFPGQRGRGRLPFDWRRSLSMLMQVAAMYD